MSARTPTLLTNAQRVSCDTQARDELRPLLLAIESAVAARTAPTSEPPAWQWLLALCYEAFPPASLGDSASAREAAAVRDAHVAPPPEASGSSPNSSVSSPAKKPSVRALRRALVHYHPDKNRAEVHGVRWAVLCEELAKLATQLLALEMREHGGASWECTEV